jgi:protein O-mannosyl-transferase
VLTSAGVLGMAKPKNRWGTAWIWSALIAAVVGFVFRSASSGALLAWDDDINIINNAHVRGLTWENVRWMFTDVAYMRRYAPLAWLNWSVDYELFGLTARSCHVGNVIFHAANAVLVFALLRRLLGLRSIDSDGSEPRLLVASAVAALIWAIHPLRVEVVAWASGRIYCQGMFFLLTAAIAYLESVRAQRAAQFRARRWWLVAAIVAYAASSLTYPIGLTFVAVLLVLDVYVLRRIEANGEVSRSSQLRAVLIEKIPFVAVAAVIAGITLIARWNAHGLWAAPPTLAEFGIFPRMMQALYVWAYYVWRPWAPIDLAPVYTALVDFRPRDVVFIASAVVVIGITAMLFLRRPRWPGLWAAWLIHLIVLVPMLGMTEHPHYTSDRYSYAQALVWSGLIGAAILQVRLPRARLAALAAMTAAVAIFSLMSTAQITVWRDNETLFRYLNATVDNAAYRADITMRLGDSLRSQGRLAEAEAFYRESLRLAPVRAQSAIPHFGLAKIAQGRSEWETAVKHFAAAVVLQPEFGEAQLGLGEALLGDHNPMEATKYLARAAALLPADPGVRDCYGSALLQSGKTAEAITQFEAAIQLSPAFVRARCNHVVALLIAGRTIDAMGEWATVRLLVPHTANGNDPFAAALQESARLPEVIKNLREAAAANQPDASVQNLLGSALAVAGRKDEAAACFRDAARANPNFAEAHFNLGVALRDAGNFEGAFDALAAAIRLQPDYAAAREELARLETRR